MFPEMPLRATVFFVRVHAIGMLVAQSRMHRRMCHVHWCRWQRCQWSLDFASPAKRCWFRCLEFSTLCRAQHNIESHRRGDFYASPQAMAADDWCRGSRYSDARGHVRPSNRYRIYSFIRAYHATRATSLAHVWRLLGCRHCASSLLWRRMVTGTFLSSVRCAGFACRVFSSYYFYRSRYVLL